MDSQTHKPDPNPPSGYQPSAGSTSGWSDHIRVRVNGLLIRNDALLMVQLSSPIEQKRIWMPPGGGLQFGESLEMAAKREVAEETGIEVAVGPLWYLQQVRSDGIHAIEFYYKCDHQRGTLKTGTDPEYGEEQIIRDADFIPIDELDRPDVFPAYLRTGFAADIRENGVFAPRFI